VDCGKWINGCEKCPLKKSYPTSWGFDRSSRNFQLKKQSFSTNKNLHLVAVSQWLADFVKRSFFHNVDLGVINNGIDLKVFKPTGFEKKTKFRILGVSSVWTKSKGLFDVFRLRELLDKDEYEIVLVGLSDEQIKSLPQGITGISRTNSVEELVGCYSSADVFVNPTYGDTFPTTNLEALACGTPVITYRTGGSPESVTVETGMVVKQGDVNALVDAVKTVQSLGKTHFSSACRNRAEQFYSKEERYNEYVELYEKLIAER
jgi:glycosyltransferase involved in cell wall biosynthesis